VFGGVFVSGLALDEARRAGLAGKKSSRLWSNSQANVALRINQITAKFSSASTGWRFCMKIQVISAVAAIVLLTGTVGFLRSQLHPTNVGTVRMPTMQELSANVDKLPAEDFEDTSLVFSRETKDWATVRY
jgi:hypothetical protein